MASKSTMYNPAIKEIARVLELAKNTKADPEVISGLERALQYSDLRENYALQCSSTPSATCQQVSQKTLTHNWTELKEQGKTIWNLTPRMLSGPLEGQLLKSLVSMQGARRVLDVGMYTGYSALSMAEALPQDGQLVTLDMDPYLLQHNQPVFQASPHGHKINIKIGNALESMKELLAAGQKFDFIFLDSDRSQYPEFLKLIFEQGLLAQNGTVAVDNAFSGGAAYIPPEGRTVDMKVFTDNVANDQTLHKVLIPIRDGVLLIRRLGEVERQTAS